MRKKCLNKKYPNSTPNMDDFNALQADETIIAADSENMISTPRRCPETTSQTSHPVRLPNQGTFRWSAISYVSQSCSCSAQQKIPALHGKSNSATHEPQREQTLVSFSCLGCFPSSLPGSFWVYVWYNTNHE